MVLQMKDFTSLDVEVWVHVCGQVHVSVFMCALLPVGTYAHVYVYMFSKGEAILFSRLLLFSFSDMDALLPLACHSAKEH